MAGQGDGGDGAPDHDPNARSSNDVCEDLEEIEAEGQEDAPVKIARDPGNPTPQEREVHNATHVPYRSWCPICVKAKGKEEAHRDLKGKEKSVKATISFDYKSFGQEGATDDKATALVYRDDKTKMVFGHICEHKGASDVWALSRVNEDLSRLGYSDMILKCDGEPAIVQVMEKIKTTRTENIIIQQPPAYDPQANGSAEKAVQDYMGQVRAMKIGLESRLKVKVESDWVAMQWIAELAGELLNRGTVGKDGRTPYYRLYGRHSTKAIVEFGEQVMAKPLRGRRTTKRLSLRDRWIFATWVGLDTRTGEHIVVAEGGGAAIRVRTILRRPMSDRWNAAAVKAMTASPRVPNPADKDQDRVLPERLTKTIPVEEDGVSIKQPMDKEMGYRCRDFKITKTILERFGHSEDCKGCKAAQEESGPRQHSGACRERIEEAIKADDILRVRLDMRDARLIHRDAANSAGQPSTTRKVEVNIDGAVGEPDEEGDKMAEDLIGQGAEQIHAGPSDEGGDEHRGAPRSSGHSADADTGSTLAASGDRHRPASPPAASGDRHRPGPEPEERQEKRRRLAVLASERRLREQLPLTRKQWVSRHKLYSMLMKLEFGDISKIKSQSAGFDISNVICALQEQDDRHPHDEEAELQRWRHMYEGMDFWDDVNDMKPLDWERAVQARRLEMDFFRKMGVYRKVDRSEAARAGCKVITTKWLDTNKGDEANPNYRSRLVGRELKMDKRLDLFSATPPLESLKMLCSVCARGQSGSRPLRLAAIDIKRAYFYAKARRPIFIEIPREDRLPGDEGKIGILELSLYGTRDAAQNWAHEYTTFMEKLGFKVGKSSPCNFYHPTRRMFMTVHGDDFTVVGDDADIKWLGDAMKGRYELKMNVIGPDDHHDKEVRVLNRIIRWTEHGLEYESDQRHAERIVEEMGMEKCKAVSTPCIPCGSDANIKSIVCDGDEPMLMKDATRYRALAARLNYLAADRPDLLYTARRICQHMSTPLKKHWELIKRVARYLKGKARLVQHFHWEQDQAYLTGFADSDWAGDKLTMKSTSGGAVLWGSHTLKAWSSSQSVVSLSSGESELYALTKVCVQIQGLLSMALDFGIQLQGVVKSDSNAAIGIAYRDGLGGRCRHIKVQYLWIQSQLKDRELELRKVPGTSNIADMMTKPLAQDLLEKHLDAMGYEEMTGRAAKASTTN